MGKVLEIMLVPVVALVCILNASGVLSEPDPGIFLNIDCGASLNMDDPETGLPWLADSSYISTGFSSSHVPKWNGFPQLNTLRYFNDTRFLKYCYHLPVQSNFTYMLRTEFYYGVYDGANSEPSFQQTIDGLVVSNVTSTRDTGYYYETTYVAKGNTTYLCLMRDQTDANPYISTISLRRVNAYPYMYNSHLSQGFVAVTRNRYSFGSTSTPRYPNDIYDRYWFSVNATESSVLSSTSPLQVLNTTKPVLYAAGNPDYAQVPQMVLQSALASSSRMTLTLNRDVGDSGFLFLHFAELDPAVNATSRIFSVNISSGEEVLVNPFNQSLPGNGTGWMFDNISFTSKYSEIADFIPDDYSVYGPIVNAAEFFEYLYDTSRPKTADADALAIEDIKSSLGLEEWTGDPCIPVPHTWVNCSTVDPPTIESVDLTDYNLAGTIPGAFAKLQNLTSLVLSSNNLQGELPDLSSLTNLRVLDLQSNSLNGSLPEWLGNLPFLTELYVQKNNFTGEIPPALNRTGPTFKYEPGNSLGWSSSSQVHLHRSKNNIWVIVGGVIGGVVAVVVAAAVIIICICVRKKRSSGNEVSATSAAKAPAAGVVEGRVPNPGGARSFSVAELTGATGNFNREIGRGGFGSVYYGKLANGLEVAVKVLGNAAGKGESNQGANEFFNEVDVLSRVHHRNLVSLLGFCNEVDNQMLVYEYLPQGSLRDRLNGLEYLHTGCNPCIVHRDVKSSNILLINTKDAAKVADFGLSNSSTGKMAPSPSSKAAEDTLTQSNQINLHKSPYVTSHYLSSKSDVYSFGVVLLELLTGRVPLPSTTEPQSDFAWTLCDWVRRTLQSGGDVDKILDPNLASFHPNKEAVWKLTDLAMMCVEPKSIHRPTMAEVVHELRSTLTTEVGTIRPANAHHQNHNLNPSAQPKEHYTSTSSDFNDSIPSYPHAR